MHRFHIDPREVRDSAVLLNPKESHHAISVLRLKTGDRVGLLDGQGHSLRGVVANIQEGRLQVKINAFPENITPLLEIAPLPQITLAVSVIKPERMELLIQKACELGVHAIIPVHSERSIVKLPKERWQIKIKRWQRIAVESCKQCGLSVTPKIQELTDYKDLFQASTSYDKILIPTLNAQTQALSQALKSATPGRWLALIGPEGDFTEKEVALAVASGAVAVSLGPLVLRSETAGIYLLSALNFFYQEIYHSREF